MTSTARPRRLIQIEKLRLVQEAAADRANNILDKLEAPTPPKNG